MSIIKSITFRNEDLAGLKKLLHVKYKYSDEAYASPDSDDFIVHIIVHCLGLFETKPGQTLDQLIDIKDEDLTIENVNDLGECDLSDQIRCYSLVAYFATLCALHLSEAVQKPSNLFPGKMMWTWDWDEENEDIYETCDIAERVSWYINDINERAGRLTYNWTTKYLPGMGGYCDMTDWVDSYGGPYPVTININPEVVFD